MTFPEQAALLFVSVVLGVLSGVYAEARRRRFPNRNQLRIAAMGGLLATITIVSFLIHWLGWDNPWLILGCSAPAGYKGPAILDAFARKLLKRAENRMEDEEGA